MADYEMLTILPGTMTEEEVSQKQNTITTMLTEHAAQEVNPKTVGKHRLAYPIKHARFGWFSEIRFSADTDKLGELESAMNRDTTVMRFVIRKRTSDADHLYTMGEKPRAHKEKSAATSATHTPKTVQKSGPVNIEDLDKKLDDIVKGDLTQKL